MKFRIKTKKLVGLIIPSGIVLSLLLSILNLVTSSLKINTLETHQDGLATKIWHLEKESLESEGVVLSDETSWMKEDQQTIKEKFNENLKDRSIEFSPNKSRSAYFQEVYSIDDNGELNSNGVDVVVQKPKQKETIFQSDFRLSNLEWLNDRELVIYRSCGTECMTATIVDTDTKLQQDLSLGVGYTWSPNKQYVAVYHYSYKYGISVSNRGNQYGRKFLEIRRDHPPEGSSLTNQTKISWSPDSAKLAVIIRKENEEKLELLVYSIENQFEILHQEDLVETDISSLTWESNHTILLNAAGTDRKISVATQE